MWTEIGPRARLSRERTLLQTASWPRRRRTGGLSRGWGAPRRERAVGQRLRSGRPSRVRAGRIKFQNPCSPACGQGAQPTRCSRDLGRRPAPLLPGTPEPPHRAARVHPGATSLALGYEPPVACACRGNSCHPLLRRPPPRHSALPAFPRPQRHQHPGAAGPGGLHLSPPPPTGCLGFGGDDPEEAARVPVAGMSSQVWACRAQLSAQTPRAGVPEHDSYPTPIPKLGCHWPRALAAGG